jgi:hypothetical protein
VLFTEQRIASYSSDVESARRTIAKAEALLAQVEPALVDENKKLVALNAMSAQLEQEAATKAAESEELQIRAAQEISLAEGALRERAIALARENQRLQLAALEATLRTYPQRRL